MNDEDCGSIEIGRRGLLKGAAAIVLGPTVTSAAQSAESPVGPGPLEPTPPTPSAPVDVLLSINGAAHKLSVKPCVTLLDALRERLDLTGTKKGCDHGQCGACTVLIDGRRVLSCLTLAVQAEGTRVTTIEGLANGNGLHPVQRAFIDHDGFQCGYCTPGQICSVVALLDEFKSGQASAATPNLENTRRATATLSEIEIRERMSGNLCRCGAYNGIVAAAKQAAGGIA
jgi:xanthine dehydrogenase YagT iron-sulfur-binding subunit